MEDILGYIRGHWTLPPGDYSHLITLAAARVIGFGTHNQGCGGENGTSKPQVAKTTREQFLHVEPS